MNDRKDGREQNSTDHRMRLIKLIEGGGLIIEISSMLVGNGCLNQYGYLNQKCMVNHLIGCSGRIGLDDQLLGEIVNVS